MKTILQLLAIALIFAACKKEEKPQPTGPVIVEPVDYRLAFAGTYYGQIINYADNNFPPGSHTRDTTMGDIVVKLDSLSTDQIYIDERLVQIDSTGHYSWNNGGGSGYQSYSASFRNDSLITDYFARGGMFYSSGKNVRAKKK